MNKDEEKKWKGAERESAAERQQLLSETRDLVINSLKKARDDISLMLVNQPTDYQQWRLPELNREIERVLTTFGDSAGQTLSTAAGKAWAGGAAQIDRPFSTLGYSIGAALDDQQLMAMRTFMVDRIKDVGAQAASKVKQELGLAMIGSQSIHETINKVAGLVDGGKDRATTIVRTELSRAWATASFERAQQAENNGVPMDKIWRRSGKRFPRHAHLIADGRRVPLNQPFIINGHELRYPHDPKAPASETINCGCVCIYRPRDVAGTLPDKRPFTKEELAANPDMAQLAQGSSVNQLLKADMQKTLKTRGAEIANALIEHMSVYSSDGRLLFNKSGDESSVALSKPELRQLADAVMLHNHPIVPCSFSVDDVMLAVWHELSESHVVDRLYHYEIVRPDTANWGPAYWAKTLKPIVTRITAEVESLLDAAVRSEQITKNQYLSLVDHMIWDRVNAEEEIGYRRILRADE